jgi:hypothetical protein
MPTFTQTVAAAAAVFLAIRREALTALGYDAHGPPTRSYVGLHTPDTDPRPTPNQSLRGRAPLK